MMQPARFAFLDHPRPLAFAHRGGALEAEENTLAAFAHAVALGYTHVETDVQATRDGVAVIFHDDDLARMTGQAAPIGGLDWSDLAVLRTRGGNPVARLDETLAAFPDTFFNLEAKADGAVAPMIDAIRAARAVERVCVGSFAPARVRALRAALGPGLCWSPAHAGVLSVWLAGWGLPLAGPGAPALQVPVRFRGIEVVTRRFVEAAHARGAQVHVWTVDETAEMSRLLALGVDGLMSDRPTALRGLLGDRGLWPGAAPATG